jgi:hypothetical protein
MKRLSLAVLVCAIAASSASAQSARQDSIILRVTSPRGREVAFTGVLMVAGEKRHIDRALTPFEVRIPAQDVDATFRATDFGSLGGEIVRIESGKKSANAVGRIRFGALRLYSLGKSYGFSGRKLLAL